ncbi:MULTISPECIES: substrate-binding domain-containing protein [unclassified Streptomyces]|uniref:substrate-binding domain-containing protein n=1 Tax=unclassified Streptomyces TaxID=2593676 RepID=UPI0036432499
MHAEERLNLILSRVRRDGSMRITDVSGELGVSPVTVRKDVDILAERGLVARVHGGAMRLDGLPDPASTSPEHPAEGAAPAEGPRTLGMIVPSSVYYYPEVIKGAKETAAAHGVRLSLAVSDYRPEAESLQAARMVEDGVAGLLLAPSPVTPAPDASARAWYDSLGVPFVLVERRPANEAAADHVGTDHAYGAGLAVRHLLGGGRRGIALLMRGGTPTAPWILEGYRAAMQAADLPQTVIDLGGGARGEGPYEKGVSEFLAGVREGGLDAALVHPENDAMVLLQRLRAESLAVPDDVALVSYDDEVAELADLPLTAVAPSKHEVGVTAVELLLRRLAEPGRPRRRVAILPELRVRASSVA